MMTVFLKGKARSGKDTFARLIKDEVEFGNTKYHNVAILAFADWLKDVCRRNHYYENKLHDRDILIQIGDEMRAVEENVFAKPVADMINIYQKMGYDLVVITDLRYENEFQYVVSNVITDSYVLEITSQNEMTGVDRFAALHPTENLQMVYDEKIELPHIDDESIPIIRNMAIQFLNKLYAETH